MCIRDSPSGELVSSGGRVLNILALGDDLAAARGAAYEAVARVELRGSHYRTDIARSATPG